MYDLIIFFFPGHRLGHLALEEFAAGTMIRATAEQDFPEIVSSHPSESARSAL
jgi:hypothetical protein